MKELKELKELKGELKELKELKELRELQQCTHAPTRNKRALTEKKREDTPTIPPYNCQRTTTRLSAQIGPGHGTHTTEKNFPPLGLERKKPSATTYTVKESKPAPSKTKPGAGGAADRRRGTQQDEGGKIPRQSNRYGRVLVKGINGQART